MATLASVWGTPVRMCMYVVPLDSGSKSLENGMRLR